MQTGSFGVGKRPFPCEKTKDKETVMTKWKEQPKKRKILIIVLGIVIALGAAYLITGFYFTRHFLPGATVNGMDCSGKTADEVESMIRDDVAGYSLKLQERTGKEESLQGSAIDLKADFNGEIDQILKEEQKGFTWIAKIGRDPQYETDTTLSYDEEKLQSSLKGLNCMNEKKMTKSEDAKVVYDKSGKFKIQPAVFGTQINEEVFQEKVASAINGLHEQLDLSEEGCYVDPVYTEDSKEVKTACDQMNGYLQAQITYDMKDAGNITVSKEDMSKWLKTDKNMKVTFDNDAMEEFVSNLASKYDTVYKGHTLKTSWGPTVTVPSGNYGWKLDQESELKTLKENVKAKKKVSREPVYARTASSHGSNDYGSTYVEINLTAQHLYFYKNGQKIVDSDFVSGNLSKGYDTPTGTYALTYKDKDAVLRGPGYASPVTFWMPFNGGVGMHDASWRSTYGGTIYKTNGSHGCINLPYSAAQKIFNNISTGDPVLVYELPGTEQVKKSSSSNKSKSEEKKEETKKDQEETKKDSDKDTEEQKGQDEDTSAVEDESAQNES